MLSKHDLLLCVVMGAVQKMPPNAFVGEVHAMALASKLWIRYADAFRAEIESNQFNFVMQQFSKIHSHTLTPKSHHISHTPLVGFLFPGALPRFVDFIEVV